MGRRLDVSTIELDDVRLLLISRELDDRTRQTVALTPSEREVLRMIGAGLSNAAIARRRRTALRTVANQVAAILRKYGVQSRHELVAAVSGGGRRAT